MKINKRAFFLGILSGVVAPAMVSATPCQIPRSIPSISSYENLSTQVKNDKDQIRDDFYAAGDDIRRAMNSDG